MVQDTEQHASQIYARSDYTISLSLNSAYGRSEASTHLALPQAIWKSRLSLMPDRRHNLCFFHVLPASATILLPPFTSRAACISNHFSSSFFFTCCLHQQPFFFLLFLHVLPASATILLPPFSSRAACISNHSSSSFFFTCCLHQQPFFFLLFLHVLPASATILLPPFPSCAAFLSNCICSSFPSAIIWDSSACAGLSFDLRRQSQCISRWYTSPQPHGRIIKVRIKNQLSCWPAIKLKLANTAHLQRPPNKSSVNLCGFKSYLPATKLKPADTALLQGPLIKSFISRRCVESLGWSSWPAHYVSVIQICTGS